MSDGVSVFECTSDDEVIDLLRGGQGVFGIALGGVWRDIEGTLAALPAERAEAAETRPPTTSCLSVAGLATSAERRAQRQVFDSRTESPTRPQLAWDTWRVDSILPEL